jgi:hypothetical protein
MQYCSVPKATLEHQQKLFANRRRTHGHQFTPIGRIVVVSKVNNVSNAHLLKGAKAVGT